MTGTVWADNVWAAGTWAVGAWAAFGSGSSTPAGGVGSEYHVMSALYLYG